MPALPVARLTLLLLLFLLPATAVAQEVVVSGMRNPYRWSFDRQTGDMWIGDVGGIEEEITYLPRNRIAGANLGWNCISGTATQTGCTPSNHVAPVHTYPSGPDVVIGGYVVRDPTLSAFTGRYLFGRFNTGISQLESGGGATAKASLPLISGFGEDGTGRLYATSLAGGVYRLTQNGSNLGLASIGNFNQPLAVAAAPGDTERLFIVEQPGVVKVRTGGQVSNFLDITALVRTAGGEEGLLGFAVAPDYVTSGRVFAFYVDNGGDLQLDEYRRTADGPDAADPATRRPLLTIQHDQGSNHNGGQLLFGPDGALYLSTGDGGGPGTDPQGDAQNPSSLLGKILRFNVGIPPAAVDTVAPALRARVKRRQRVLRLRGAVARFRCSEQCSVVAGGRLRIGKRQYKLRRVGKSSAAGKLVRVRVVLPVKARRPLRRALESGRNPRISLGLRARDATGNRSPLTRRTVIVVRR
jgi:Glucose / Sorbosone dehydrogenase